MPVTACGEWYPSQKEVNQHELKCDICADIISAEDEVEGCYDWDEEDDE